MLSGGKCVPNGSLMKAFDFSVFDRLYNNYER